MSKKKPDSIEQQKSEHIEALASLAALFGVQLEHYGRLGLKITFKGDTDRDWWFAESDMTDEELDAALGIDEDNESTAEEWNPSVKDDYHFVKEPESLSALVAQILTLLHPNIKSVFGSSAIYQILSTAASVYGREGKTVEEKINGMSFPEAAQAWIISKRIFATNHLEDLQRMISFFLQPNDDIEKSLSSGKPLDFEAATDNDRKEVTEYCEYIISQNEAASTDAAADQTVQSHDDELREITEVQSTGNIVLLQSEVARKIIPLAKGQGVGITNVGSASHPVIVKATIGKEGGHESVVLARTDYDVMEAVGQLVQENGKGIIITPSQIYQKIAFSDTDYRPSSQTINEIVSSMDKLLFTPASIDFTQQIEKHTKLKAKNKDIESGNVKGTVAGNLISGLHLKQYSTSYRGKTVEHSFLIYDMPMFYYYSQTIRQLVTVPGYLLSGDAPRDKTAPKKAQKPSPAQQRLTLKEIGLRRYLLGRIEYCKRLRDNKKQHEFMFAFVTIAQDIGYEIDTQKRQRMLREQTYEFMQEQVAKNNIKKCDYYYKGRALSGIKIIL